MASRSRVTGYRETIAAFRELARYVAIPANEASRYALAPTLAAAKANAPKRSGLLRRSLTIRRSTRGSKLKPRHYVGPDNSVVGPKGEKPIKYAHIDEFGRAPNKDGKGRVQGTRFLTRAYEETKELVVKRFGERMGPAIEARAAKLAKNGKL
jgi:HK97 gp10 family phage protein